MTPVETLSTTAPPLPPIKVVGFGDERSTRKIGTKIAEHNEKLGFPKLGLVSAKFHPYEGLGAA